MKPNPKPKLWTVELLQEQIDDISKEILKKRISQILEFAREKKVFAESLSRDPQFYLKSIDGKVLAVYFSGRLYAHFGSKEVRKYPSDEVRRRFVEDLKRLNLLPQDINPDEVKSGKYLERKLDDLSEEEFTELLKILERTLISK
jgi:hypothetical protein